MDIVSSHALSKKVRLDVLDMVYKAKAAHIGAAFSIADIVSVLYSSVLTINPKNPNDPNRDYFLLSKGHAGASVYSVLAELGFFPKSVLDTYEQNESLLSGHVSSFGVSGVEFSTGSLGHGPSIACGIAHALLMDKKPNRVFVLIGDGENEEGSVWEAASYANHFHLSNLTIIVDNNRMQAMGFSEEIMNQSSTIENKWKAFGFDVLSVDGHDHQALYDAFNKETTDKPKCVICNTVKGKGVDFFENNLKWHYSHPSEEEYKLAKAELLRGQQ